jgi:hypothetical protein
MSKKSRPRMGWTSRTRNNVGIVVPNIFLAKNRTKHWVLFKNISSTSPCKVYGGKKLDCYNLCW